MEISLVIPVKNEEDSLEKLYSSIRQQTRRPDEIVMVDGGSTDRTVEIGRGLSAGQADFRFIETPQASPGKGRNVGAENARSEWIAFTDAGIRLEPNWLENLVEAVRENPELDVVYGNYAPAMKSLFEKCATLAYVPPQRDKGIRGRSIVSCLLKREVWETVGGFPDLRAAEDLMFMEAVEENGFNVGYAPKAMVFWQLQPNLSSTFRKFVLYSKHNVLAGRQWDWHYGVARQYLIAAPFIVLAFLHSWWWLAAVALYLLARTAKRILLHRDEFGLRPLFNPVYFFEVLIIILSIDLATFVGWWQAIFIKRP
jgi:glycosyltransferase involved in cell wall biosynthesis